MARYPAIHAPPPASVCRTSTECHRHRQPPPTESQQLVAEVEIFDSSSASNGSGTPAAVLPEARSSTDDDKREAGRIQAGAGDILKLVTDSDSWVEVVDADGIRLMYDILRPEAGRELQGTAPFLVFLGNTPGILITMNDHVVQKPEYDANRKTSRFIVYPDGSLSP